MKTFRIDDISLNTDAKKLSSLVECLCNRFPDSKILLGVSPVINDMSNYIDKRSERIFPQIFNAYSDHRIFFNVQKCGIPEVIHTIVQKYGAKIDLAGHGLIHVDHRLLTKEVQELSILVSCSLIKSKIYIPPFNKWNKATEEICAEHSIKLIKFEEGWKHIKYESINDNFKNYYFHTHDFSIEEFQNIILK